MSVLKKCTEKEKELLLFQLACHTVIVRETPSIRVIVALMTCDGSIHNIVSATLAAAPTNARNWHLVGRTVAAELAVCRDDTEAELAFASVRVLVGPITGNTGRLIAVRLGSGLAGLACQPVGAAFVVPARVAERGEGSENAPAADFARVLVTCLDGSGNGVHC